MNYYFDQWYREQDVQFLSTVREGAEAAWCYQQERIDLLEDQVDGLEDELHFVRAFNYALGSRMKDILISLEQIKPYECSKKTMDIVRDVISNLKNEGRMEAVNQMEVSDDTTR